jgi:monothiol glutaredoxin
MPIPSYELEISPVDVKKMLDDGVDFRLIDVRTPHERALACIEPSALLSEELYREAIDTWPKETRLVFYCHTGIRSLGAADHFHSQAGFQDVKSMSGGISAWSAIIDTSIPIY